MPRVVVTRRLPIDLATALGDDVELWGPREGAMSRTELIDALRDADALIAMLTDQIDEELLAVARRLRIVANHAVGLDNVDVEACTRRGVMVTNTPDVLTQATADLAFSLMLAASRRLVEADAYVRVGAWRGWDPSLFLGGDVWGRTLGIIGLGRIGRAVAQRARGFDMEVLYSGPRQVPGPIETALRARWVPLTDLLSASDFVSIHCPLTPASERLLGAAEFARMKPTAYLVNTARGAILDEHALADALDAGQLAGAGLDVFAHEPEVPVRFIHNPRVILAPHIGSATTGARTRMAELCAQSVRSALAGQRPANLVNSEVRT